MNQQRVATGIYAPDDTANRFEKFRVPDKPGGRQALRPQILNPYSKMSLLQPFEQNGRNDLRDRRWSEHENGIELAFS
ncbi:hypothetical protein D3C84_853670 [compost metagenome]